MILLIIFNLLLILVIVNLYFWNKTTISLEKELRKQEWFDTPKDKYAKRCYDFVADRFGHLEYCYFKRPWRNIFYTNMWKLKSKGLPCHMANFLFQKCLLKKFSKSEVKTAIMSKPSQIVLIHFFSKVKINDKWVPIDAWGKKIGTPYGKMVYEG